VKSRLSKSKKGATVIAVFNVTFTLDAESGLSHNIPKEDNAAKQMTP